MQNNEKKRVIHLNDELIPVTEEIFQEWYRPIWKTFRLAYRHGRCRCPNWQLCKGDCGLCEYRRAGDQVSMEQTQECGLQIAAYRADPSEIVESRAAYEALLQELDAADPNGRRIAQLLLDGVDDRTAAEMLGLSKSAYSRKKIKLRSTLRKQLESDS